MPGPRQFFTAKAIGRPLSSFTGLRMFLVALLALSLGLVGCGRAQRANPVTQDDYAVSLTVEPAPPVVGDGRLRITISDRHGQPVNDARLQIEGNMSHAGMTPVFTQAAGGESGTYTAAMKWTMAGDWYLDVRATLPDGRIIGRRFEVSVR
jgi:hypothetical protein